MTIWKPGCLKPDSIPQKDGDWKHSLLHIETYFNLFQSISYDVASMRSTFLSLDSYAPFFLSSRLSTLSRVQFVKVLKMGRSVMISPSSPSSPSSISSVSQISIHIATNHLSSIHPGWILVISGKKRVQEGPRCPIPGAVQVLIAGLVLFSSFISLITGSMSQLRNMKADKSKQPLGGVVFLVSEMEPWMVQQDVTRCITRCNN